MTSVSVIVGTVSVNFNTTVSPSDQLRPELVQVALASTTVASAKANNVPATSSVKVWAAVVRGVSRSICNDPFERRMILRDRIVGTVIGEVVVAKDRGHTAFGAGTLV